MYPSRLLCKKAIIHSEPGLRNKSVAKDMTIRARFFMGDAADEAGGHDRLKSLALNPVANSTVLQNTI
jgi:hypothetical protein